MVKKFVHNLSPSASMRQFSLLALSVGLVLPIALANPARTAQLTDGRSAFDHAPHLVRAASSFHQADAPSTYQFTLTVPVNAGASLQAVRIVQEPNAGIVMFDMSRVHAFRGDSFAGGTAVSLANIGGEKPADANEVMVVFDPPIPPGETVTVSLETDRNPRAAGAYLFGVTAFPTGEHSPGLFLGYGRVDLFENAR
jgi:hypothetical protein